MDAHEFDVTDLDRPRAANRPDDSRYLRWPAVAARHDAWWIELQPVHRIGETVEIAFAPDFAVADDIDPCAFLVVQRGQGAIVLRFFEPIFRYPPDIAHAYPRRSTAEQLVLVHVPTRLWIAAH